MASAVFSEAQASPFTTSPSSPLIPNVTHDTTKRLSALLTPTGSNPTSAGELSTGIYINSQRNSSGTLSPSAQATMSKRQSGPPQGPTPSCDNPPVMVSDLRSDVSTASSGSSLTATNPTPIIIPTLSPSPVHSSSSSPFATPASCTDTTPCTSSLNPGLAPPSPASSSPGTSAFRTPASSFADPSTDPPSLSLTSTRPAPRSPAMSRRGSRLSLGPSTWSRNQSGLAIEVIPSPMETDPTIPASNLITPTVSVTESSSTPTAAAIPASTAAPATTPTPAATTFTEPLIILRDYAFAPTDDRFHGRGPFVPKFNRLPRLNAALAGELYESDSEDAKQKEREKKKKKKYTNGWSDSDTSDMDAEPSEGGFKGFGPFGNSSTSSSSGEAANRVIPTETAVEDEEVDRPLPSPSFSPAGGWGMLGFGMDWLASSTSFSRDGFGGGDGGGKATNYPSQMELERNFGQGAEFEDYSGDGDAEDGEEAPYLFDQDYSPVVESPLPPGSYRALYVFEAVGDAEMGLEEGQIVTVVGKERGDGWAVVNDTREGKEGRHALVPEGYLELVQLAD